MRRGVASCARTSADEQHAGPARASGAGRQHLPEQSTESDGVLEQKRLSDVARCSEGGGLLPILVCTGRSEDDDRHAATNSARANALEHVVSRSSRQIQVENDQVGTTPRRRVNVVEKPYGFLSIADYVQIAFHAVLGQGFAHEPHIAGIVFDEQYAGRSCGGAAFSRSCRAGR